MKGNGHCQIIRNIYKRQIMNNLMHVVYWFICTILQITILYYVESPVDERVTAAAGSLANLEVILLQKSSSPFLVDISSPLLSNQVPPQISKWLWLISLLPEQKSQLKSLCECLKLLLTLAIANVINIFSVFFERLYHL